MLLIEHVSYERVRLKPRLASKLTCATSMHGASTYACLSADPRTRLRSWAKRKNVSGAHSSRISGRREIETSGVCSYNDSAVTPNP
jgi:hypothetical protein